MYGSVQWATFSSSMPYNTIRPDWWCYRFDGLGAKRLQILFMCSTIRVRVIYRKTINPRWLRRVKRNGFRFMLLMADSGGHCVCVWVFVDQRANNHNGTTFDPATEAGLESNRRILRGWVWTFYDERSSRWNIVYHMAGTMLNGSTIYYSWTLEYFNPTFNSIRLIQYPNTELGRVISWCSVWMERDTIHTHTHCVLYSIVVIMLYHPSKCYITWQLYEYVTMAFLIQCSRCISPSQRHGQHTRTYRQKLASDGVDELTTTIHHSTIISWRVTISVLNTTHFRRTNIHDFSYHWTHENCLVAEWK